MQEHPKIWLSSFQFAKIDSKVKIVFRIQRSSPKQFLLVFANLGQKSHFEKKTIAKFAWKSRNLFISLKFKNLSFSTNVI